MDSLVWAIFAIVYFGMILGRLPGLALDRTGIALLGAIALLAFRAVEVRELGAAIDEPTMILLFGLMVLSAQFRMSGFYSQVVRRLGTISLSPSQFLAVLLTIIGVLSALLVNDIVCLASTPVVIEVCSRRSWNPKPFLLGLAAASNIGSMATLIGNPQNMLIGQVLHLPFGPYLLIAIIPTLLGLGVVWSVIYLLFRNRWDIPRFSVEVLAPSFDRWQAGKGILILAGIIFMFLFSHLPRDIVAVVGAGLLLCSRRMRSQEMLGLIDWQLLILFFGLFLVNYAMKTSGNLDTLMGFMESTGLNPARPLWLFILGAVLSNIVSNVPAIMLLLPSASGPASGYILAYASTLAGNLFIIGSIANIIVVSQASAMGIEITWREHARAGIPITLITLFIAALWLWLVVV